MCSKPSAATVYRLNVQQYKPPISLDASNCVFRVCRSIYALHLWCRCCMAVRRLHSAERTDIEIGGGFCCTSYLHYIAADTSRYLAAHWICTSKTPLRKSSYRYLQSPRANLRLKTLCFLINGNETVLFPCVTNVYFFCATGPLCAWNNQRKSYYPFMQGMYPCGGQSSTMSEELRNPWMSTNNSMW
jgi:hypothetical protein